MPNLGLGTQRRQFRWPCVWCHLQRLTSTFSFPCFQGKRESRLEMVSQHVFDRFHDDGVFATGEAGLACLEVRCGYRRRRTSAALRNTMDNTKTCSSCSCTAADTAGDGTS